MKLTLNDQILTVAVASTILRFHDDIGGSAVHVS